MIHLRTVLATSALSVLCTILVNCGGNGSNNDNPNTSATDSGADSPSVTDDGSTSSNDSLADSSIVDDASSDAGQSPADAGGTDSGPQAFSADCAGTVDHGGTTSIAWTYTVDDTGGTSLVHATIQVDAPGAPLCTGDASFAAPAAFSDWVTVPCGAGYATLGLDRTTMKVDIRSNSAEGTQASWLPNCR